MLSIMDTVQNIMVNEKISLDQFYCINGIMVDRIRSGILTIILRKCLDGELEADDADSLAADICNYVIDHRDGIPLDPDLLCPYPPF